MKKTKLIQIYGRVQNVGFRYAAVQKANELEIKGFVKNMPDKSVYIEAQGTDLALEHFLLWCQTGPNWASVTNLVVNEVLATEFVIFSRK